ncbi:MAG: hypothetical protein WBA42_18415 [Mesorhizobium sp.]
MREIILAGALALSTVTCLAQTTQPSQPASSEAASGAVQQAASQQGAANLCQDLLGFMKAPPPEASKTDAAAVSTPKEKVLTIEAAQKLADANDIAQCQKAAREMRVAGVAMPPPLIALAALDLKYQQKSGAAAAPAGTAGSAGNQ